MMSVLNHYLCLTTHTFHIVILNEVNESVPRYHSEDA